jgi:hypothetical protein
VYKKELVNVNFCLQVFYLNNLIKKLYVPEYKTFTSVF